MSDNDDDVQTPTTSGASQKKKVNTDDADKGKEPADSDTKKDAKKKASILKTVKTSGEKSKKKSVKIDSPEPTAQPRGAYVDHKSARYRLAQQPERTQKSHSIANVVPRREAAKRQEHAVATLNYTYEVPSSDRDHQLALDFLERSSPFHARESLLDLRRKERFHQHHHHHHHRKDGTVKRHVHHTKRCRSCLEIESQCECSKEQTERRNSDWASMVKPDTDPPRTWTNPRLDWLEELEESSEGLRDQLEEKFTKEDEVCCFPFSTFNIFKKKELKVLDFYTKN